jgi:hypothetical protein
MEVDMTAQARIAHARQHYGFWLDRGPGGLWFLFVPVGTDPADGAPLHMVRRASAEESTLWLEGRLEDLVTSLRASVPVMPQARRETHSTGWRRFVQRLRKVMGL